MIRIISLSLLALMFSCANTRPESAEETSRKNTPAAESVATPEPKEMAPLSARNTHIPELKLTPADNGHQSPAKPAARRKTAPKAAVKTSKVNAPASSPASDVESTSTVEIAPAAKGPAEIAIQAVEEIVILKTPETTVATNEPVTTGTAQFAPSVQEIPSMTVRTKREREKRFLPTRRRIDREVNKLKFAYKGEVMMGLTASYGTLSSDDTDFMLILDNINASGTIASVKPFIGYFYRDNNCIGIRFGYNHVGGSIKSLNLDMGESNDVSFSIPYLDMTSANYSFGVFHRSYAGLDPKGRFGLFAEFELALSTGSSDFSYESGGALKSTFSDNTQVKLSFNPGAAVYIFPNVCATLSFGLGGLQYTSVTQKDALGNKIGSRKSSNMKFKLNVAAINFGMTIHMWDKKKQ